MKKNEFLKELKDLQTENKDVKELYMEVSALAMKYLSSQWRPYTGRAAYYFSIEYLMGRMFYNNLMELGVAEQVKEIFAKKGVDMNIFEEVEDAALGNGGLGRLAACFLDSAAGLSIPLYGYGIRYKYGLFKQQFINGYQVEEPDDWLAWGDPWSVRKERESRVIHFADFDVTAVPYDMPIIGKRINTLRLYQAEGSDEATKISEYLYPADDTEEGKILRIRQEYFFSAAAIGELVDKFVQAHGTYFKRFPNYHSIQLNDTHPVMAIAELIRILTKEYAVGFSDAVRIAKRTFNYTNHTILPEALECWDYQLLERILPDIAAVFKRLQSCAGREWKKLGCTESESEKMAIVQDGRIRMANAAVYVASSVNGVAEIHSDILKKEVFAAAYHYYPDKFQNKTNGVTQRRWLMLCNGELSSMFDRYAAGWRSDMKKIEKIDTFDQVVLHEFIAVKETKKKELLQYIREREGIELPKDCMVYSQIKRLHEYKRQLMTAFAILRIYFDLKDGKLPDFYPSVFLFGAKAASCYYRAKGIIKYINEIANLVNHDPQTRDKLRVVFVQNYNVSYAEKIVAGSNVSLQVSTAGLEASGTGNMKFMMNGAVTVGTMDGANIEIVEKAGRENNYIFGATVEELTAIRDRYDPNVILTKDLEVRRVVETLTDGTFQDDGNGYFSELYRSLTEGAPWHKADNYFVLYDLPEYVNALLKANSEYGNKELFSQKALYNATHSSYFSSDRTIAEYAADIWKVNEI